MYEVPSYLIAIILLILLVAAIAAGSAIGRLRQTRETEASKNQTSIVLGSLVGILALTLGFTFSLSLNRYDQRSVEVVGEANALGTAWLRTDLVGEPRRTEVRTLLQRYGSLRAEASRVAALEDPRLALVEEAEAVFAELWVLASEEARELRDPVAMGFLSSLNDVADVLSARDAAIRHHVPELVMYMLFATFIMLGGVAGYSSGISDVRPGVPVYAMILLIVALVFLIIDLDRPRRGLIEVDQSTLISTVAAMSP